MTAPASTPRAEDELVTIRDWLRWGVSGFNAAGLAYGHGTASALDEAAFLILETLHLPIDQLEPWLDCRLTADERRAIRDILARRIETRKPAPYLTGTAYIQNLRFRVDERVIVPRSYVGELIAQGRLDDVAPPDGGSVLELCTGSGCLAILAALRFAGVQIDAVDLSAHALAVARTNVADYGLEGRIALLEGDLFQPVAGRRYDLIIANPPYVAAAEVAAFPAEFAAEPAMAHLGGADGLDLVRRILAAAADHLTPEGTLVMEIGTGRELLEAEHAELPFLWLDTEASEGEVLMLAAGDLTEGPRRKSRRRGGAA
jgi:ribosomal protein L3 glutamine methyltransferase